MVRQSLPAPQRTGSPDRPRQKLGKAGLVFFKDLIGGPPAGWELEQAQFTVHALSFSVVKGPRRLEFSISPEPHPDRGEGAAGCVPVLAAHGASDGQSAEAREVLQAISSGLFRTSYVALITRLMRDSLCYSDPGVGLAPSRLDRYYRINDHTLDFWKFVYPQWRCLEEKVALGAHWVRINYATRECRLANPNPGVPSLRYFADERPDQGEQECLGVEPIITEADVLGGRTQEILGRELERVAREMRPAFIHVNTTCMPELIGDTPAPFISRIEGELGVPVFWTSKTRPSGPFYTDWIRRLLDKIEVSPERDPRAVLLAGIPSASAQAQAVELCQGLGLRVVGTLFPNLDFSRTPEMGAASAVVWLDPIGWSSIDDGPFLRQGLSVVRYHPPYGSAGTRAWLERIASVLMLDDAMESCARLQAERAAEMAALREEASCRTVVLIGDLADIELLTSHGHAFGFSLAAVLGELGFHVRCLVCDGGASGRRASLRRPPVPLGAGTIEFVPFSSRAQLDRQLARDVDLVFSHLNHDERLSAHGLSGFTEASFELGFDGLLRTGRRLLAQCAVRPFPRHRSCLSPWTS